MKTSYAAALILALATLAVGQANAQEAYAKTRDQVRSELAEAVRTGDVIATGETPLKLNQLYPSQYPVKASVQGKTREQVRTELSDALRRGDIMAGGESKLKLNELYPNQYPAKNAQAKSQQVKTQA
jgi:hypothetical protein